MAKINRPRNISDYIKIQPDNLSNKEKLILSIISIILLVILSLFVQYMLTMKKDRKQIEEGFDYENCVFEVVGFRSKFNSTVFMYTVSGKEYNYGFSNTTGLQINEKYQGRYKISRPDICLIYLTKPEIDTANYKNVKAEILNTGQLKNKKWIEFKYEVDNKAFNRRQYVEKVKDIQENKSVEILYNINNPKISYIKK